MWRSMAGLIVLGGLFGEVAAAAEPVDSRALQQIVEQSADRFVEAFEQQDAEAIAQLFTAEAEYVDAAGVIFHGRSAIAAEFAAAFAANLPGTMRFELISIRPIADGVLVEDGVSTFSPQENGPASQTRYTATHVQQADGSWLMASVRELEAGRMTPHDRLEALAWLLGKWHEDVAGRVITTEWKWSDDGNFLMSDFSIQQGADLVWTGTHRIGWDAEQEQFRSWIFESGGGTLEGTWWPNEDGTWSVGLSGVDADGERRSSTLTYGRDGEQALVVSQTQRVVGGESLPATVHRIVPQPPGLEPPAAQQ